MDHPTTSAKTVVKKPRSEKQLANDEKLRSMWKVQGIKEKKVTKKVVKKKKE